MRLYITFFEQHAYLFMGNELLVRIAKVQSYGNILVNMLD